MIVDVLVAEIGSTTTCVNAFDGIDEIGAGARFLGQGVSRTTVAEEDVRIGLNGALTDLKKHLGTKELTWRSFYATSSAAGGLRMTVHGLVYDMTVRAAKEAALGAGANIHQVTAGKMRERDIDMLLQIKPNIILIAGGVDYGERETALYNSSKIAEALAGNGLSIPVLYGGNVDAADEVRDIFSGYSGKLTVIPNIYPRIDELKVVPARKIIQDLFEEHIVQARGMEHIRDMVDGPIVPTPGGVMLAAQLLKEEIGDVVVFDVGGATTDLHSVTSGSENIDLVQISPQPEAKRTVEGDLGVYVNRRNILKNGDLERGAEMFPGDKGLFLQVIENLGEIPVTEEEKTAVEILTQFALETALRRHAGVYRTLYGSGGRTIAAEGKDLTAVKYCIGTGGALTRLGRGKEIMERVLKGGSVPGDRKKRLYPPEDTPCLLDSNYIMASLGVLSKHRPKAALKLLKESLV